MDKIEAPWSDEQVRSLNGFQRSGVMHPFTCPRSHRTVVDDQPDDRGHLWRDADGDDDPYPFCFDHVRLVADVDGWWCPAQTCNYTQPWAWEFMADGSWREAKDGMDRLLGTQRQARTSTTEV